MLNELESDSSVITAGEVADWLGRHQIGSWRSEVHAASALTACSSYRKRSFSSGYDLLRPSLDGYSHTFWREKIIGVIP